MTGISLTNVPDGSKLILLGDWYRVPGSGWQVVCYFLGKDRKAFRQQLPIDLLPALTPGTEYPRATIENKVNGYTGNCNLPDLRLWRKFKYGDIPNSLKRLHEYSGQIENQIIYCFEDEKRVYWLPAIELARMLFFHSAEVVREAVYQGNAWQLARAERDKWIGKVVFTSNVPVSYMNSIQFRKFFAWMMFNGNVQNSFCSIFQYLNQHTIQQNGADRWTFDFDPPDISGCGISWSGFTGTKETDQQNHCYIREIRSISGMHVHKLEAVDFSHPDDFIYLESNRDDASQNTRKRDSENTINRIDPENPPNAGRRRLLIRTKATGFHFDTEIDLRRSPRQIRALPKGEKSDLEEIQDGNKPGGIIEGRNYGSIPGVDIDNLEEPELVDGPEKFSFFQALLEQLETESSWPIKSNIGEVPRKKCRFVHMVENHTRKYLHAVIQRDETTIVHALEIELGSKESLSTLFFRSDNGEKVVIQILDALMTSDSVKKTKALQWNRQINTQLTISRQYLEHPDKRIKDEENALESWVARAISRVMTL